MLVVLGCGDDVAEAPVRLTGLSAAIDDDVTTIVVARWTQDAGSDASWVTFGYDDVVLSSPPLAQEAGERSALLLGIPADTAVWYRVHAESGGTASVSEDGTARTGPLPEQLTEPLVAIWSPDQASPEDYVFGVVDPDGGSSYSGVWWLFIANRDGRVVWYRSLTVWMSMFPRVARDGTHIVYSLHSSLDPVGDSSVIQRSTLDGRYLEEISAPGIGWAWDELDDGTLLYDRNKPVPAATLEEIAPDGSRRTVWDCAAWQAAQGDDDYENCYTNTVNWVAETDTVLWSTYWGDYGLELDRQSGEVLWHAGNLGGGLSFEPPEAVFDLQHYLNYTPEGTLLASTHIPDVKGEQRAREYIVDWDAGVLEEVWSFGAGVDSWAQYSGEATRLVNGNTLINYGTGGDIREVTADGETVWWLQYGDGCTLGHTQLVSDLYAINAGR
jgi:hypothetical protein